MILLATSIAIVASAPVTTICVANEADEGIGVMASQHMPDDVHIKMKNADVEVGKEPCFSVQWESNRPIHLQAARKSDHSDKSLLMPRCPEIAPGSSVRIAVGHVGADLTCVVKEKG